VRKVETVELVGQWCQLEDYHRYTPTTERERIFGSIYDYCIFYRC